MRVFGSSSKNSTTVWGPTASVAVKVPALGFNSKQDDWILAGISVGAKEIVDVRQCFNDVSYIYALGNDQGRCMLSISLLVFLGSKNCKGKDNTGRMDKSLKAYVKNRVSKHTAANTITIGSFSRKGWLIGADIGQFDMNKATCLVTGTFIMQLE